MDGHHYTALFEAPGGEPVLKVYLDTKHIPTVGIGNTGPDVKIGDEWAADRCWAAFYSKYSIAEGQAKRDVGSLCWYNLNEPRRAVLVDMAYNNGGKGLAHFVKTLDAVRRSQWQRAHDEILDSEYAHDVKGRAVMNANVMLHGTWPGEAMV